MCVVRTASIAAAVVIGFLAWPGSVAASSSTSNHCAAEKVEASGEFAQDVLLCARAKSASGGGACLERAEAKLAVRFTKPDARGGCKTTGDAKTPRRRYSAAA
jgi:hypothetical protein